MSDNTDWPTGEEDEEEIRRESADDGGGGRTREPGGADVKQPFPSAISAPESAPANLSEPAPEQYTSHPKAGELAVSIVLGISEGEPSKEAADAQDSLEAVGLQHLLCIGGEELTEAIARGVDDALFDGVLLAPDDGERGRKHHLSSPVEQVCTYCLQPRSHHSACGEFSTSPEPYGRKPCDVAIPSEPGAAREEDCADA